MLEFIVSFLWQMFKFVFVVLTWMVTLWAFVGGDPWMAETSAFMWASSFVLYAEDFGL